MVANGSHFLTIRKLLSKRLWWAMTLWERQLVTTATTDKKNLFNLLETLEQPERVNAEDWRPVRSLTPVRISDHHSPSPGALQNCNGCLNEINFNKNVQTGQIKPDPTNRSNWLIWPRQSFAGQSSSFSPEPWHHPHHDHRTKPRLLMIELSKLD